MKKFFKALALVLALVLVIGAIPASAATTFTMKKDVKRVYLGGAQGKKADGTVCKTSSKYRISKLINGFDAATMTLKLESSDKSIVKTNNSKRKVYGKKIGSATVKISVYDKESGILLDGSLSATIEVKKNADPTTVRPIVKDANGKEVDPSAKYALNSAYTVIISRKDAAGNLIDTDKRSLVCTSDNKDYVEIKAANDYTTMYTVTFKKAGDYTFAISNYQSSTWNAPINTIPFTATAGYTVQDVKQVALNQVRFTFETEVSGLTVDNFNTYYEVDDTKVYPTGVQAVDIDPTDKTQAVVTFLSEFIGGEKYYFEYGDSNKREDITYKTEDGEEVRFFIDAAKVGVDSADKIIITLQQATAGKDTALTYKVVDKNGIDITSFIKEQYAHGTGIGDFSFELVNPDIDGIINYGSTDEPVVYIAVAGRTYTVKASYSWWSNTEGKMLTAPGTGTIESVAEAVYKRDMSKFYYAVSQVNKPFVVDNVVKTADVTALTPWSVTDKNVYLQAAIGYVNDRNGEVTYETLGKAEIEFDNYYVKSSNDNVVMVASGMPYAADGRVELTANQKGSAWIIVYGQKAGKADVVVGTILVNVVEAREAKKLTVTSSKKKINAANAADEIKFDVKLFDQFDKYGTVDGTVKVELFKGNKVEFTTLPNEPIGEIIIKGNQFTVADPNAVNNTVLLKFTLNDTQISETVQIFVGNETVATKQILDVNFDTVDTALKFGLTEADDVKTVKIQLVGQTANGYEVAGDPIEFAPAAPTIRNASGAVAKYVYTIAKNGVVVDATGIKNFDDSNNTIKNITKSGTVSPTAIKLEKGTYTITAYVQEVKDGKVIVNTLGTAKKLVVTENRPNYKIKTTEVAEKLDATLLDDNDEISRAFYVEYDGKQITDGDFKQGTFKVNGETKSAFVQKVVFKVGNEEVGYDTIELPVGAEGKGVVVRGL